MLAAAARPVFVQMPDGATLVLAGLVGWLVARVRRRAYGARCSAAAAAAVRAELAASAAADVRQVVVVGDRAGSYDDRVGGHYVYDGRVLDHEHDRSVRAERYAVLDGAAACVVGDGAAVHPAGGVGRAAAGRRVVDGDSFPAPLT